MSNQDRVRSQVCVGYTFMFKGMHSTITQTYPWGFRYSTYENDRCWMHYDFFQTIPHYISKFKVGSKR